MEDLLKTTLGKSKKELIQIESNHYLHQSIVEDFLNLQLAAKGAGFKLEIASSFRSFERQLKIWNTKAKGERDLLSPLGEKLDSTKLSPMEVLFAILRWSAIPGFSRHHWGTDLDIYDQNGLPKSVMNIFHRCMCGSIKISTVLVFSALTMLTMEESYQSVGISLIKKQL